MNPEPQNPREWAPNQLMYGNQYNPYNQDLYNNTIECIKGEVLNFSWMHLNDGNGAMRDIIHKYINTENWNIMARHDKKQLPVIN